MHTALSASCGHHHGNPCHLPDMSGTVAKRTFSPLRMDSCVADPHQELLVVFKERNLRWVAGPTTLPRVFVDLLGSDGVDVNLAYPLESHKTMLQLAVEAPAMAFVQELLRHPRVDPNLPDQVAPALPSCLPGPPQVPSPLCERAGAGGDGAPPPRQGGRSQREGGEW